MKMKRFMLAMVVPLLVFAWNASADIVVFTDGARMTVQRYEVKGNVVLVTTPDGKLRSVPLSYVNLEATERLNGSQPATVVPPVAPTTPATPTALGAETEATSPPPAADMPSPAASPNPGADMPPPVWTNDELGVSLVVPSEAWQVQDMVASFDVAVQLEKQEGDARATLALIRRSIRDYQDFLDVIGEIETSVSATASYRFLGSGPLDLGPYTVHELRFVKEIGGLPVYNRIVAYYSEDLAYVLSLACPESKLAENQEDFDSLVRGVVIKKSQAKLTPKGKPDS